MVESRAWIALLVLMTAATGTAVAGDPVFSSRGIAIRGYDPVAYVSMGRPVKGSPEFSYGWKGARWHFASAKNRDTFAADPERHAPAYGGWCAFAVANGSLAKIDPEAFTIHDGRLFLNYSLGIQEKWRADMQAFIRKGDANYPGLVDD